MYWINSLPKLAAPIKSVTSWIIASFLRWCWYSWIPGTLGSVDSSAEYLCVLSRLCRFPSKSSVTEVTPLWVTAGHHTDGTKREETVIVLQSNPWRYSRNYGYHVLCQLRNVPRGLHSWRRENYTEYEISMFYGKLHAHQANHADFPHRSCNQRESWIRLATQLAYRIWLCFTISKVFDYWC